MTDNQVAEMFRIMTTVVTKIQVIEDDVKSLKTGQGELSQDVNSLKNGQDELRQDVSSLKTGQGELRRDFDELKKGQDEFRAETNENFIEVKRELRLMNRKVNI